MKNLDFISPVSLSVILWAPREQTVSMSSVIDHRDRCTWCAARPQRTWDFVVPGLVSVTLARLRKSKQVSIFFRIVTAQNYFLLEVFIKVRSPLPVKVKNDLVTSRGRQCSFMSFSALLCARTLSIESWTDQILFEGDKIYLNAFERRIIPDTDTLSHVFAWQSLFLTDSKKQLAEYQEWWFVNYNRK